MVVQCKVFLGNTKGKYRGKVEAWFVFDLCD